ncbi:UDP-glucoronosyl and UDP-glucosyl transferase domain-containing protein [Ditylenchus destructor]|nr:UDP-glucoronosyl and UDP-glucosyl transferase domain-containing protein [Ditylenchus destructor]
MVDTKFLKGQKFHVGIAESSTINLYAFALFHSLEIKKTVTIKAYSLGPQLYHDLTDSDNRPKKENETYMDPLKNADPPIPGLLPGFPGSAQMYYETRFLWGNSSPQLEWDGGKAIKSSKKFAFIGGVHFKKDLGNIDQAISDKLKEMTESKTMRRKGKKMKVVLISFGTVINTIKKMNKEQFLAIRDTIKDFATENPQYLFVWQLTEGDERIEQLNSSEDLPNVYATHWVNMQALLAHKVRLSNIKKKEPIVAAYMSHCGRNSQLESVYYSIPTICVPNFMDQYYNAETLAKKQMSIVLDFKKHSG